ncbi:MAG: DUF4430 domain-containing protein [Sulfurimonadaceae bacterium]
MKLFILPICTVLLSLLPLTLSAADENHAAALLLENKKSITVEIDYGGLRPSRTIKTAYVEGMSALKLLQQVAKVKTHKAGAFVFVKSIDKVKGEAGKMGWFYSVDGVSAKKLAKSYILTDVKAMKWSYKVEACY